MRARSRRQLKRHPNLASRPVGVRPQRTVSDDDRAFDVAEKAMLRMDGKYNRKELGHFTRALLAEG
jgi:hypothetical protein